MEQEINIEKPKNSGNTMMIVVGIIVIIVIAGAGFYFYTNSKNNSADSMSNESTQMIDTDSDNDTPEQMVQEHGENSVMNEQSTMDNTEPSENSNIKTFTITGKNYEYSVKNITVNKGDTVKINFSSTQGMHDWNIDEFNAHTKKVTEGNSTSVEFVANKTGEFEYYCSVANHRALGMVGTLTVN
jgi:plastocyanin